MSDFCARERLRRASLGALALLLFLIAGGLPLAAQEQGLSIQTASLRLWPEYDDPGVLVLFSGEFEGTTAFPQQVQFPVPAAARGIQATYNDPAAGLLNQPWKLVDSKITYTLPGVSFHTEYYVDRPPSGNQRTITYTFVAPYAIQALEVSVQQPARASGFKLTPQPESSIQGSDGFTYHVFNRTNLAANDKIEITIEYSKTDTAVSAPQLAIPNATVAPAAPAPQPASKAAGQWLPYLLIGLGLAGLAGAGIYWLLQRRQLTPAAGPRRASPADAPKTPNARPTTGPAAGPVVFCPECGRPFGPEDRFCAQCGKARRS